MRIHRSKKLNIAGLPLQFPEGDRPTEPDTRERGLPFASDRNRNYNDEVATERQPQKSSHWNRPKKHAVFLYSFIPSFLCLPSPRSVSVSINMTARVGSGHLAQLNRGPRGAEFRIHTAKRVTRRRRSAAAAAAVSGIDTEKGQPVGTTSRREPRQVYSLDRSQDNGLTDGRSL